MEILKIAALFRDAADEQLRQAKPGARFQILCIGGETGNEGEISGKKCDFIGALRFFGQRFGKRMAVFGLRFFGPFQTRISRIYTKTKILTATTRQGITGNSRLEAAPTGRQDACPRPRLRLAKRGVPVLQNLTSEKSLNEFVKGIESSRFVGKSESLTKRAGGILFLKKWLRLVFV